ncbi:hypothetical protein FA13DRAFT_1757319 [Coprinellus micaceus]|uniref:(4-O-methyl)-D-glucuronate--lignin esterase n=1 Tax=Coprinellus micaceus TaxID=71717 RepID=A0A4Y7SKU7_COPMI|nr:hypothetical protein FA13DRAFT_1757319 [Coprinellus micaceus]
MLATGFAVHACTPGPGNDAIPPLPDPFTFLDGRSVTTKQQWSARREEISGLLQKYQLGTLPNPPANVTGRVVFEGSAIGWVEVVVTEAGRTVGFTVNVENVPQGDGPFPAIIVPGPSHPFPSDFPGVIFLSLDPWLIAPLGPPNTSRGKGLFYDLYGADHPAGSLIAYTWAISRLIDVLEKHPESKVNVNRLGVTGCYRDGKSSIVAAAFEPRIRLAVPMESGVGGTPSWRISNDLKAQGVGVQRSNEAASESTWYSQAFEDKWSCNISTLPYDQHLLLALIAPRALLVIDNPAFPALGSESSWGSTRAARTAWQALGAADSIGLTQSTHYLCTYVPSQKVFFQAYIDRFLKDKGGVNTTVWESDKSYPNYQEGKWVQWKVPQL